MNLNPREKCELALWVERAFDMRYDRDALDTALRELAEWIDRLPFRRIERWLELDDERRRRRVDELVQLLRATDPARIRARRVAA